MNYEEWSFETEEDWIEAEIISTDYWEDYSAIALAFEAQALPEGITGRTATVDIIADGAVQTFTIYQGEGQGIEVVKEGRFDNKNYDVLGREVNDDAKGVIIRNGKKVLR